MKSQSDPDKKIDSKASAQTAIDLMKPGPEHAKIAKMIGTWKVAYTPWSKDGAELTKATGQATFTKLFNGRFIQEKFKAEFESKAFTGIGTMGFDRAANLLVHTWYDSRGTGITFTNGAFSANDKELVLRGTMTCPMKGEMNIRHVYRHESDDKMTLTMYGESEGKESKSMEMIYTRSLSEIGRRG